MKTETHPRGSQITGVKLSDKLLTSLKIDCARWPEFCALVAQTVDDARNYEPWEFRAGEIASPLECIARKAVELDGLLAAADRNAGKIGFGTHAYLDHQLRINDSLIPNTDMVQTYRRHVRQLSSAAKSAAAKARDQIKGPGRPTGIEEHPRLAHFVARLADCVWQVGGRVVLDKRNGTGNLIDLLKEIRPSLPRRFMPAPEKHPISTYDRIVKSARAAWWPAKIERKRS